MKAIARAAVGVACFMGGMGCSQADLYPVTRDAIAEDGTNNGSTQDTSSAGSATASVSDVATVTDGTGGSSTTGSAATCPEPALAPGDSNQTVLVDGLTRSYVLHVPPAYDGRTPAALVVDFHGIGGSAMSQRSNSPYPATLDSDGVVMAFAQGLEGPLGTAWNVGPCCVADVDDVAYTRALVAHVQATACIDTSRIYAVGVLTGGGMAHYLGCHAADLFAAVAPAAFDLLEENVAGCAPERPITVVTFRGTADARVPYTGGPSALVPGMPLTFLGAEASFEAWSAINGCSGTASPPDTNGCSAYTNCNDAAEVVLCTKQDGPEEPGDPEIAWPILKRHQL